MKILIINGPNLNRLGKRNPDNYGRLTLDEINKSLSKIAENKGITLEIFQSNHEGEIIDYIQENSDNSSGILINPGALTHYGYSLRDAIIDTGLPVVEVHLSVVEKREKFRKIDILDGCVLAKISGFKEDSYYRGLMFLINKIKSK